MPVDGHTPVRVQPVCELLAVQPGQIVVDATVGAGGHAVPFAESLGRRGWLIGLDVDPANLRLARTSLHNAPCRVSLLQSNFSEIRRVLRMLGVAGVDVLFADLGVSSTQLDEPGRGFSFQRDGPLDMRMDPRLSVTAADLVNRLKERELADLLYHNAQETGARRIARAICQARRDGRITTTGRLARVVAAALGIDPASRKAKIHPATRSFLALRMVVNDEINSLQGLLEAAPQVLRPGGRFGVISFHSVEDKPVKLDFKRRQSRNIYQILTKKPVVAEADERRANPRSRSAKLRVVMRLSETGDPVENAAPRTQNATGDDDPRTTNDGTSPRPGRAVFR